MSDAQLSFRKSANIDRVTDKRKDSLFRLVDTDGSGTIDAQEFAVLYDAIKKDLAEELEKEAELQKEASSARRRFKMLLLFVLVLVSFLAASVAANFAVIFTVVDQAITTTTTSTGLLEVKGSDTIAKTAVATENVPLIIAPALDIDTLGEVKTLKIKYSATGSRRGAPPAGVVEAQLSVVAVRKHNATFVEFVTDVPGEVVAVINGDALFRRGSSDGARVHTICSANATCSAFRASGIDVDAALEVAKQDLVAAGFEAEARRLSSTLGMFQCSSWQAGASGIAATWTSKMICGWEFVQTNPNSALNPAGSDWRWTKYCFQTSSAPWGELEDEYNTGEPYYPFAPQGAVVHAQGTPTGTAIVNGNELIDKWWPPHQGGLMAFYYNGWGPQRHMVFFAHGKGGQWYSMYDMYCIPASTPLSCPDFKEPDFEHLVFVFGGSGLLDPNWGAGWSYDVYDGSTYADAANAVRKTWMEVKPIDPAFDCEYTGYNFVCEKIPWEKCEWYLWVNPENVFMPDEEPGNMQQGQFSATAPDKKKKTSGDGGKPPEYCIYCYYRPIRTCPFNHKTEMMVVGYSDGGGFATYMNYGSTMVTKAVAIDFWNYNAYDQWLQQSPGLIGGSTIDMKIYTACESNMFDLGPHAILPHSTLTGTTYLDGAGLAMSDLIYPTGLTYTTGGGWWHNFEWLDSCAEKKVEFFVHGLDPIPGSAGPPATLPDSDDAVWASFDSNGNSVLGTACTDNYLPAPIHSSIAQYVPTKDDIMEWLDPAAFGSCTGGRRLSHESGRPSLSTRDYEIEHEAAQKPYDVAGFQVRGTKKDACVRCGPKRTKKAEKEIIKKFTTVVIDGKENVAKDDKGVPLLAKKVAKTAPKKPRPLSDPGKK